VLEFHLSLVIDMTGLNSTEGFSVNMLDEIQNEEQGNPCSA